MNATSSGRTSGTVLLADIGGTNTRFALLAGGKVGALAHMAVSNYGSFREALGVYLFRDSGCCRHDPGRPQRFDQQFLGDRCR
jgi:glucokinase